MIYRGRVFSREEVNWIQELVDKNPNASRSYYSIKICEKLNWKMLNGEYKAANCRAVIKKMGEDGILKLLPVRSSRNRKKKIEHTLKTAPESSLTQSVGKYEITFALVDHAQKRRLWNEYIDRYHYLKYAPLPGASIRYFVYANGQIIALLGFNAAAWKVAPRDQWIGWDAIKREKNLLGIVNNTRFLILPWIRIKNGASRILSFIAKQLPLDWEKRYGYRPVLLETFVEKQRFSGTCYKAANWIYLGDTKGRGKRDRTHQASLPIKGIWVYPLQKDFRRVLCMEGQTT